MYTFRYGFSKLEGECKCATNNCNNIEVVLNKVSNEYKHAEGSRYSPLDTPSTSVTQNEDLSPVADKLFKIVHELSMKNNGKVVHPTISNIDKNYILESSKLKLDKSGDKFIENDNDEPFEAAIDVYDFNDDGENELILWKHNGTGPMGGSEFTIYYKPPGKQYKKILTDYGIPIPSKTKANGFYKVVVGGPGFTFPEYTWDDFAYRHTRNVTEKDMEPQKESELVGGSTPEELGRTLLKALKTNNKELWMSCLHPAKTNYRDVNEFRFKQCRDKLEGAGVSNWSLINFSRVTYEKGEPPIVEGETVKRYFVIEFTYKNKEFLGALGQMTIMTYKTKNYFLVKQWEGAGIIRNEKNK